MRSPHHLPLQKGFSLPTCPEAWSFGDDISWSHSPLFAASVAYQSVSGPQGGLGCTCVLRGSFEAGHRETVESPWAPLRLRCGACRANPVLAYLLAMLCSCEA